MKFTKLTSQIKLSSALITATTMVGVVVVSVPVLLALNNTNNKKTSSDINYQNIINRDNNEVANIADLKSQPAEIQGFFLNKNTKFYASSTTHNFFVVVTKDDGFDVLYAWGKNYLGQLGLDDKLNREFPALVSGLPEKCNISHIRSAINSTTIVINGTQIWSSGYNSQADFGDGNTVSSNVFIRNSRWNNTAVKSLHVGRSHRIVVTANKVWVWGNNDYNQLGTSDKLTKYIPFDLTSIIAASNPNWASGEFFANDSNSAMIVDGHIYIWGKNSSAEAAIMGPLTIDAPPKLPIGFPSKIAKYSIGTAHSLALLENGDVYAWGYNAYGQLGLNDNAITYTGPTKIISFYEGLPVTGVINVFTSNISSFIQTELGIYSCGNNDYGILGQGATVRNPGIFSPMISNSNEKILNIINTSKSLMVHRTSGLYMVGSNDHGEFAFGFSSGVPYHTLTLVTPFGTPGKPTTKSNNKSYNADEAVADLMLYTGSFLAIKNILVKYFDGVENILGTKLSYKVLPVANADKTIVTFTLTSNSIYNVHGAKAYIPFDIDMQITNFGFKDSTIQIKNAPVNVHTGNIQTVLNPIPGSVPSDKWQKEIIDMNQFPLGTTFRKIMNDEVIGGADTSGGIYRGQIVPSKYYYKNTIVTSPEKAFNFEFTKLTKIVDSLFSLTTINQDLNINNIDTELPVGQAISAKYLSMFVYPTTFPPGTKFILSDSSYDINSKTYSGVLSYDKCYKDGLLTAGSKQFTFNTFKAVKDSELVPIAVTDDSIHSSNLEKLLKATNNINTIRKLININLYPPNTKFIFLGVLYYDKVTNTYTGILASDQTYQNWEIIQRLQEFSFTFTDLMIMKDSSVVNRKMPPDYDIDNIGNALMDKTEITNEVLNLFIKTDRFPPNTTFTISAVNKDIAKGRFNFNIVPSHYYKNNVSIINVAESQSSYPVTMQFAVPDVPVAPLNLALIIGLSVGGAALLGIIVFACIKYAAIKRVRKNKTSHKRR